DQEAFPARRPTSLRERIAGWLQKASQAVRGRGSGGAVISVVGLNVPELVRQARIDTGMTAAQFASQAGSSRAAIHAYETGSRSPGIHTLERILAASGKRPDVGPVVPMRRRSADVDLTVDQLAR